MTIDDFRFDSMSLGDFDNAAVSIRDSTNRSTLAKVTDLRRLAYEIRKIRWGAGYKEEARALVNKISEWADDLNDA